MPVKVLMVCLGNICRSPLAEGILSHKASTAITVDSAGTGAYHIGEPPDPRSIAVARENGISIANQKARKFVRKDFERFDYIYVMDRSNLSHVMAMARTEEEQAKIALILKAAESNLEEVPDPYYGGEDGFEYVFRLLDEACDKILDKLSDQI